MTSMTSKIYSIFPQSGDLTYLRAVARKGTPFGSICFAGGTQAELGNIWVLHLVDIHHVSRPFQREGKSPFLVEDHIWVS